MKNTKTTIHLYRFYRMTAALLSSMLFFMVIGCGNGAATIETEAITETAVISDAESEDTLSPDTDAANATEDIPEAVTVGDPEPEEVFEEYDITLMAVGDNLMHMGIVNTGKMEDGSYDYSFLFDGIADYLDIADIKIINQETIFGGNERGFSGFPKFNSPTEAGDAIANAGFNVVLQATNHTADQDISGIENCVSFWQNYPEILVSGFHSDIPLITEKDVTFAILNYTYGPNMETLPKGLEDYMNLLCPWNENNRLLDFTTLNPQVLEDIRMAKQLADIVIVCPHWGTEYESKPSSYQETFAMQMTEAGADIIIGTHPHVVQPVEWVEAENGNRALCFYSLGNYASTQQKGLSMLEAMAWITFHVTEDGVFIQEEQTGVLPLVCQYTTGPLRFENVYLLENYTEEKAAAHGIHGYGGVNLKLSDLQKWSEEILGDKVLTDAQIRQDLP